MSAQIHDRGYRAYDGERAGERWAIRSLALHSVRRALGLKRSGRHKIAPVLTIIFAFVPAIGLAAAAMFLGREIAENLPSYADYYGLISFALLLFTAAVVPGVLTTDRTSGMLALYLASPLTRTTYVVAKALGIFAVMLIVTLGPVLFLVIAFVFVDAGPTGLEFFTVFGKALLAGILAGVFWTSLGMLISSFPKRWGIASVAIVGTVFVMNFSVALLTEQADAPASLVYFAPPMIMGEAWQRIFGQFSFDLDALDGQPSALIIMAAVGYTLALTVGTWWQYQRIEVDR